MKRTKFIALALVVAIMLMGAGYAAWTDEFTSTNVIETGDLEVSFVGGDSYVDIYLANQDNFSGSADSELLDGWERIYDDSDYYNVDLQVIPPDSEDPNAIDFSFTNLFPGVVATSHFTLENTGTVPVAIQDVEVTVTDKDGNAIGENQELYNALQVYTRFIIDKTSGTDETYEGDWVSLSNLQTELTSLLKGKVLQNGDNLTTLGEDGTKYMWFSIPKDSLNGDEGENQNVKISVKFNFVQSNLYEAQ